MASTNDSAAFSSPGNVPGKIAPNATATTSTSTTSSFMVKAGLAQMLKGGVISKNDAPT